MILALQELVSPSRLSFRSETRTTAGQKTFKATINAYNCHVFCDFIFAQVMF